ADLSGADLSGANLIVANLSIANVKKANFSYSNGISKEIKQDLIKRGAIFEDSLGDRSLTTSR
ncbi:pentapeptide repeat-containing protein, partial [Kamptonema sp. PCC 6506]